MKWHVCQKKIAFSTKTTSRRQDDLIHTERSCFQLVETPRPSDSFLKVRKVHVTTYFAPGSRLDWTTVGVFKYVTTSVKQEYIRREQITGKLVNVPVGNIDVLVSVSLASLREAD